MSECSFSRFSTARCRRSGELLGATIDPPASQRLALRCSRACATSYQRNCVQPSSARATRRSDHAESFIPGAGNQLRDVSRAFRAARSPSRRRTVPLRFSRMDRSAAAARGQCHRQSAQRNLGSGTNHFEFRLTEFGSPASYWDGNASRRDDVDRRSRFCVPPVSVGAPPSAPVVTTRIRAMPPRIPLPAKFRGRSGPDVSRPETGDYP